MKYNNYYIIFFLYCNGIFLLLYNIVITCFFTLSSVLGSGSHKKCIFKGCNNQKKYKMCNPDPKTDELWI